MTVRRWVALLPVVLLLCAPLAAGQEGEHPTIPRMSVDELLLAVLKKRPVTVIDVRALDSYDKKIPGALQIPVDAVESRLKEVPRNKQIITYCA